ncbi:MAG: tRNA 2-thiouridine(34) synthase MnmA [Armatimonadetes bacterium]|nr:tRNA 2-thiouridine(34) synthase MnmA [Armatimonadota bacterium]
MSRVIVAMSGGVDSSVAAALMHARGHEVIGVTMTLSPQEGRAAPAARGCCSVWDVTDAEKVAWKLGIAHYVFNLRAEFQKHVIDDFLQEYARGRTPNPCRRCNQHIKFDHLLERARELGAECVVTGHYARLREDPATGRYRLLRGKDPRKDQSYVLASLTQEQLRHVRFPIGELRKAEVRALAEELELGVAHKAESQDLCFIPDRDTAGFLERNLPPSQPGPIVDSLGRRMGEHRGLAYYTVGQRRGLGLAGTEPRYVLELEVVENTLVVGGAEELAETTMRVDELNWVSPGNHRRAQVQFRSTSPGAAASLEPEEDCVAVRFDRPQRALTPGQAAVFYRRAEVLGGGTIRSTGRGEARR